MKLIHQGIILRHTVSTAYMYIAVSEVSSIGQDGRSPGRHAPERYHCFKSKTSHMHEVAHRVV